MRVEPVEETELFGANVTDKGMVISVYIKAVRPQLYCRRSFQSADLTCGGCISMHGINVMCQVLFIIGLSAY